MGLQAGLAGYDNDGSGRIYCAGLCVDREAHEHDLFHRGRHCVPVRLPGGGRSLQFGRTSAPIIPHLVHTALRFMSRSTVSSGQRSALMTAPWWQ
jgi:hypothetical protein